MQTKFFSNFDDEMATKLIFLNQVEESEEKLENAAAGLTINDGAEEEVAEEVEKKIDEQNFTTIFGVKIRTIYRKG